MADDKYPLIVIKLAPGELDAVQDAIAQAAEASAAVQLKLPEGQVEAHALKTATEWAVKAGVELRIKGEDRR